MIIREAQIKALEQVAIDNFVDDLSQHCWEFSPYLCKTLKPEELHAAIREGIRRADAHGFNQRGPVRFYVDLMIVLGSGFDTDPQYPWAAEILAETKEYSQITRSETLHEKTADYLEKVDGENNAHTLKALEELSARVPGLVFRHESLEPDILRLMKEIHPRKYNETGEEALRQLIADGTAKGRDRYGFQAPRALGLTVVLMFAFGHQFDEDPFLPWISRTLNKEQDSPETRAEELERRALIWLDAVLKNAKGGK